VFIPPAPAQEAYADENQGRIGYLPGAASGAQENFRMWIHSARNAGVYTTLDVDGMTANDGKGHMDAHVTHKFNTKIKELRIYHDSGALALKGKFYLYGLKTTI